MNFIALTDYFADEKIFINMSHVSEFKKRGPCTELIYPTVIDDEDDEIMRLTLHVKEEPEEIVARINRLNS